MSLADEVRAVLADTMNLPPEFMEATRQNLALDPITTGSKPNTFRKASSKQVVNTVALTDLLNGEITIPANLLGTTGALRLTAWGDWKNTSGAASQFPQFQLIFGSTTLIDTNFGAASTWASVAVRYPWKIVAEILNMGSSSVQSVLFKLDGTGSITAGNAGFVTGEGVYSAWSQMVEAIGWNSGAVNTTVSAALILKTALKTANASLDVTLEGALVEII